LSERINSDLPLDRAKKQDVKISKTSASITFALTLGYFLKKRSRLNNTGKKWIIETTVIQTQDWVLR